MFLGVPFNIASYALLAHMLAQQCDLEPGELVWTGGDCHLYLNHLEQAEQQLAREPYPLPRLRTQRAGRLDFRLSVRGLRDRELSASSGDQGAGGGLSMATSRRCAASAIRDPQAPACTARGVFALRRISKGTRVVEYLGDRVTHAEADARYEDHDENDNHTFLFIVDKQHGDRRRRRRQRRALHQPLPAIRTASR